MRPLPCFIASWIEPLLLLMPVLESDGCYEGFERRLRLRLGDDRGIFNPDFEFIVFRHSCLPDCL